MLWFFNFKISFMQRVIIETPYGKNPRFFSKYAKDCMKDSFDRNEAPLASHVLYATSDVLSENIKQQRELGIKAGYKWMEIADLVAFYMDYGWSGGMQAAYNYAKQFKKKIQFRSIFYELDKCKINAE